MRRFAIGIITLLCLCIMFTSACSGNKILEKPDNKILEKPEDTTLEFWIAEKVSKEDFKDYCSVEGVFGGYVFFEKKYLSEEITEEHIQTRPDHCVTYTVTAYPDYSSNKGKIDTVTGIRITVPDVSVYGITCNSTLDDFDKIFNQLGCKIQVDNDSTHSALYGKSRITFTDYEGYESIYIGVEVTNKHGIIF